jgi:hypothetical protein
VVTGFRHDGRAGPVQSGPQGPVCEFAGEQLAETGEIVLSAEVLTDLGKDFLFQP